MCLQYITPINARAKNPQVIKYNKKINKQKQQPIALMNIHTI